jgi:hypothetical protein
VSGRQQEKETEKQIMQENERKTWTVGLKDASIVGYGSGSITMLFLEQGR